MRIFLFFFLTVFIIAKPFKVATYNVQNLFDAHYQGSEYEEYIPGKHNWNSRMVEIKLNHIAEVICDLDADILGLQEVENEAIFIQLKQKLKKVGCGYNYSAITHKKGAPIQIALLSRYKIKKQKEIQVSYSPRVRNILEVDIAIHDTMLTLFVNHWKSKAYKGYESKRIKYAKALQSRIARLASSKEYMLLGDFNSDYNANLTLNDRIDDTQGKTGFCDVLHTQVEEYEILKAGIGKHYTLWNELPISKRWSHKFYGKKSSLDHIVLPQKMFDGRGVDYVNNSFRVFGAKYLFTKRGYINSWRYKNGKHMAKGYSDHLPIYAYFDTKPYIKEGYKKHSKKMLAKKITYLYSVNELAQPIMLKNVLVVMKRGRNAIIKKDANGRGVYLFGCAGKLKEGYRYDLRVDDIKRYHGLKEVTSAYIIKSLGKGDKKYYYTSLDTKVQQNDVLHDIVGIYSNKSIKTKIGSFPVYFKKKGLHPKNGSKIKIAYAQIGYYKRLQLVIHSTKDFTVLE